MPRQPEAADMVYLTQMFTCGTGKHPCSNATCDHLTHWRRQVKKQRRYRNFGVVLDVEISPLLGRGDFPCS